ncbi:adrenodoxin, mitochondrial-like [Python bivittatus]|uniref:Adrenodoxin, mitochondrial-like n=1 Tax=Python bivittatus TaxID=176946 RepID=A0A9F5IWR2_PYTBI|nr:adrenodoxin, mitochondrial-like [Python bivittatus]
MWPSGKAASLSWVLGILVGNLRTRESDLVLPPHQPFQEMLRKDCRSGGESTAGEALHLRVQISVPGKATKVDQAAHQMFDTLPAFAACQPVPALQTLKPQDSQGFCNMLAQRIAKLVRLGASGHGALGRGNPGLAPGSLQPGRCFGYTQKLHNVPAEKGSTDKVRLHFINRDGEKYSVAAKEGESLLEVVINHNINIDGFGACEGTLACSTCHLIFEKAAFQQLDEISDDELDMLDLAYGLTDTSRLGCQVCVKKWMDGLTVQVPTEVSDVRRELEVEKQNTQ